MMCAVNGMMCAVNLLTDSYANNQYGNIHKIITVHVAFKL